jgi:glycosyltransferase involved in cell wall biosynthesis
VSSLSTDKNTIGHRKVLIALNAAWNLVNFRGGLIRSLVSKGYEVVATAPLDEYAPRLQELGCRYVPLPMDNKGTHPGRDMQLLWRFFRLLRDERPDVFLGYTVKPNIYGSLAAHALGIPVINNIAGLGTAFMKDGWLARLVRFLYRLAFARSRRVFFQNDDDRRAFVDAGLVDPAQAGRVPGSGIDLQGFSQSPSRSQDGGRFRFLLVARMLWDKGVGEYVDAARLVRRISPSAEFCLLGFLDVKNPTAISRGQMQAWVAEGVVAYLGATDDVRPHIAAADCIVLPSYYGEGVPRTLLEAAAMGRPIVTTDAVGCREVVEDGVNGFLCRPRDAADLAAKLERMMALSPQARARMGRSGREKMEREFDERIVIDRYLAIIEEILGEPQNAHLGKN